MKINHRKPALHNSTWPGVVGKGSGSEGSLRAQSRARRHSSKPGVMNPWRRTGEGSSSGRTSTSSTSPAPTTLMPSWPSRCPGGQGNPLRKAAGPERRPVKGHGRGCRESRRSEHGLVQLSSRARGNACQRDWSARAGWGVCFTIAPNSFRIGRFRRICPKAAKGCGVSMFRLRGAASLETCLLTASTPLFG